MIADPHRSNASGMGRPECPVAIAEQESRCFVPGKAFGYLPGDPLGGWIGGDVTRDQPSATVVEDRQALQKLERDRPHHEQVDRCDAGGLIAKEGLPTL
jgi:hypothetical protein